MNKSNITNWRKKSAKSDVEKCKTCGNPETVELDKLYGFLEREPHTETRGNIYILTMVSRKPRQIVGHVVSANKSSQTIQQMVDAAPEAEKYCTDGYGGYLDVVFPGNHIFNVHNKNDTFTVESVNDDLRHYIPTLARRSRCVLVLRKILCKLNSTKSRLCPSRKTRHNNCEKAERNPETQAAKPERLAKQSGGSHPKAE